ncbi:MAG TPA: hypothetical protein VJP85_05565 [Candidatus Baltobacteraceae bacterium]|nr:hypothetical protein [Candidatus Baltobacteraceae bacterium]
MIDRAAVAARGTTRAAKTPKSDAVTAQQSQFDEEMEERSELEREANVLRDMMLEQLKEDDAALKKYIAMI